MKKVFNLIVTLALFGIFCPAVYCQGQQPQKAKSYVFDTRNLDKQNSGRHTGLPEMPDILTFQTLQGIVNRDGPVLYQRCEFHYYQPVNEAWLKIYEKSGKYELEYVPTFSELINKFRGKIKGLIGYGTNEGVGIPVWEGKIMPYSGSYLAAAIGGLNDLLPVPSQMLEGYSKEWNLPVYQDFELIDYKGNSTGVKIKGDLKKYEWANLAQLTKWSIENVLPYCNPDYVHHFDYWGIDFAVQHKGFVFTVGRITGYDEGQTEQDKKGYQSGEGLTQNDLFRMVLTQIKDRKDKTRRYSWIMGFVADETSGALEFSKCDMMNNMINWGSNWSFHTKLPGSKTEFKQKFHYTPMNTTLTNKKYIAVMGSESTTQKASGNGMQHGTWLSPNRGKVPINWGMKVNSVYEAPAVVEYYYNTARDNDYFISAEIGAGLGFALLDRFSAGAWEDLKTDAIDCWSKMDIHYFDLYAANDGFYGLTNNSVYADFCDAVKLDGIMGKSGDSYSKGVLMKEGNVWGKNTLTLQNVQYPDFKGTSTADERVAVFVERLGNGYKANATAVDWRTKFLVLYTPIESLVDFEPMPGVTCDPKVSYYSFSPTMLCKLVNALNKEYPGEYQLVRLDELFSAMRLQYGLYEKIRVDSFKPGMDYDKQTGKMTITWDTPELADSTIYYRIKGIDKFTNMSDSAFVKTHSMIIDGMENGKTYEFVVLSTDKNGKKYCDSNICYFSDIAKDYKDYWAYNAENTSSNLEIYYDLLDDTQCAAYGYETYPKRHGIELKDAKANVWLDPPSQEPSKVMYETKCLDINSNEPVSVELRYKSGDNNTQKTVFCLNRGKILNKELIKTKEWALAKTGNINLKNPIEQIGVTLKGDVKCDLMIDYIAITAKDGFLTYSVKE
jgi:hypothetical protein